MTLGYKETSKRTTEKGEITEGIAFSPTWFTKHFQRQSKNQSGKFQKDNWLEHSLKVPKIYEMVILIKSSMNSYFMV